MADYSVKTQDGLRFDIDKSQLADLDIVKNNDGTYHLLYGNKSYNIKIIDYDLTKKKYILNINDREVDLHFKDSLDQMLDKMGFFNNKKHGSGDIKSPMPGLVLHIDVDENQEVKKGDTLLVLEAMKMENLIKAAFDGTVQKINVEQGEAVSKNQVLLVIK